MKRRRLLAGLGTLATGSAAAVGTGAFTSAEATRSVDVNVADEDEAYLALDELDGTVYENATFASQNTSNQISIDINDANGVATGADGVGLDSVYEFDNVFQVENQGTQEVEFEISTLEDSDFTPSASDLTVEFYPGTNPGSPLDSNPITLGTGDFQRIGLKIDIKDPDVDDFSADATVSADAT